MVAKRPDAGNSSARRPVPKTPEGREIVLQALAFDLAEKRLIDGSASSAEIVYLLKSSTTRERLEIKRLENENLLALAKVEQIRAQQGQSEMMEQALQAFSTYSPSDAGLEDFDD